MKKYKKILFCGAIILLLIGSSSAQATNISSNNNSKPETTNQINIAQEDIELNSNYNPEILRFNYPSSTTIGMPVRVTVEVRDYDNDRVTTYCDFGDGAATSKVRFALPTAFFSFSHIYLEEGSYTISVWAVDGHGASSGRSTGSINVPRPRYVIHGNFLQFFLNYINSLIENFMLKGN